MRQESCTKVLRRPRQCVPFRARRPLDPCSGPRAKGGILKHSGRVEQTPRCPTRRDFPVGTARSRGSRPPRSRHRNQISPVAHGAGICTALTDIHFPLCLRGACSPRLRRCGGGGCWGGEGPAQARRRCAPGAPAAARDGFFCQPQSRFFSRNRQRKYVTRHCHAPVWRLWRHWAEMPRILLSKCCLAVQRDKK